MADVVTDATNEFLDCFRGGVGGYVSESAAICFHNADPRGGNLTTRAVMVFADAYHNPLINAASAAEQDRPCWSRLVRDVWPSRKGQAVLVILTTDMKRRLWPKARIGPLGNRTPVLYYDSGSGAEVLYVDWPRLIECLGLVEDVYSIGFVKDNIKASLYHQWDACVAVSMARAGTWERSLTRWRGSPEFQIAVLIAQKREGIQDGNSNGRVSQLAML
jgi:hypothetical protein